VVDKWLKFHDLNFFGEETFAVLVAFLGVQNVEHNGCWRESGCFSDRTIASTSRSSLKRCKRPKKWRRKILQSVVINYEPNVIEHGAVSVNGLGENYDVKRVIQLVWEIFF